MQLQPSNLVVQANNTRPIPVQIRLPKALVDAAAASGNAALLNTPADVAAAGGERNTQAPPMLLAQQPLLAREVGSSVVQEQRPISKATDSVVR